MTRKAKENGSGGEPRWTAVPVGRQMVRVQIVEHDPAVPSIPITDVAFALGGNKVRLLKLLADAGYPVSSFLGMLSISHATAHEIYEKEIARLTTEKLDDEGYSSWRAAMLAMADREVSRARGQALSRGGRPKSQDEAKKLQATAHREAFEVVSRKLGVQEPKQGIRYGHGAALRRGGLVWPAISRASWEQLGKPTPDAVKGHEDEAAAKRQAQDDKVMSFYAERGIGPSAKKKELPKRGSREDLEAARVQIKDEAANEVAEFDQMR